MTTKTLKTSDQNATSPAKHARNVATCTPRFDIWETADELVLSGDLPGVAADSLDIEFEDDQLVIHGRVTQRGDERKQLYAEYSVGDFQRSFTIGESIDPAKITAEVSGGVLTVHLPKSEQLKRRRIEVKGS